MRALPVGVVVACALHAAACVPNDEGPDPDAATVSETGGRDGTGSGGSGTGGGSGGRSGTGGAVVLGSGGAVAGTGGARAGTGGAAAAGTGGRTGSGGAAAGSGGRSGTGGAGTGGAGTGGAGTGGAAATGGAGGGGGAVAPRSGLYIDGRFLKDPCGQTVMIRGFEQAVAAGLLEADAGIPEMAKTGANYVRLLVTIPPAATAIPAVSALRTYIDLARANGMLVELALSDGTAGDAVYARQEVKDALAGQEDVALVRAVGEATQADDATWVSDARAAVMRVRGYGYKHVLFVGSRIYAREPNTVLQHAAEVLSADPQANVHFFVQLYWGNNDVGTNYYVGQFGMTIGQALDRFAAAGVAIQAGLLSDDSCCGTYPWVDFEPAMARAQQDMVGWLWRDWHNPSDGFSYHATTDGKYGDWKSNPSQPYQPDHGMSVSIGHAASIKNTSVRTTYMRTRACN